MRRRGVVSRVLSVVAAATVGVALAIPVGAAQATDPDPQQLLTDAVSEQVQFGSVDRTDQLEVDLLATSDPDECFGGIGQNYEPLVDENGVFSCPDNQQLKVNQAYVWGMAKQDDQLWFGTGPNVQCLMMAQYIMPIAVKTDSFVCEGSDSAYLDEPIFAQLRSQLTNPPYNFSQDQVDQIINRLGDWRPPDLYAYDLASQSLVQLNDQLDTLGQTLLGRTLGIRSAGAIGDTVIFAGPDISTAPNGAFGAVNFFVFKDGQYLGATTKRGYTNIRKWVEIDGTLYTGVGVAPNPLNPADKTRGAVLRFDGASAAGPVLTLNTTVVGKMTTSPSEFTEHDGRIFTSTWPVGTSEDTAGIFMSPPLDGAPLDNSDADLWTEVWNIKDYEPDPVLQRTMAVGPVQSYKGQVYWGTMNVPFVGAFYSLQRYVQTYGVQPDTEELLLMLLGTHRATTIFRGQNFADSPAVQLLYGNALLPTSSWAPPSDPQPPVGERVSWSLSHNNMNAIPRYGLAGFGNPFNTYTRTMAVNRGDLYVGTFDDSYLISSIIRSLLADDVPVDTPADMQPQLAEGMQEALSVPLLQEYLGAFDASDLPWQYGADLWRFMNGEHRAVPEFINGADNRYSYGIRTMISSEDNLYLGMANPMNLEAVPTGEQPGGWQLVQLSPWPTMTRMRALPEQPVVGEPLTLQVRVRAALRGDDALEHGNPWGILKVYADDLLLGSCQVLQGPLASCEMVTSALTAGDHTFYATFSGTRTWEPSVSEPVTVTVGTAPPLAVPQAVEPQPEAANPAAPAAQPLTATTLQVGAVPKAKQLRPQRTTTLVKYAQTNAAGLTVQTSCVVQGKTRKGKAARKACGIAVTKVSGNGVKVSATPQCNAATRITVRLSAQAQGAGPAAWNRTWSVAKGACGR